MNIIITGSSGFLGQHLVNLFHQNKVDFYSVPHRAYDLRHQSHIDALFNHAGKPDIIYHLAAHVGGIEYNLAHPAELFYDNIMMNTQLIQKAAMVGVKKFIFVSSVCAYPQFPVTPTEECQLWKGQIEPSNETYGISKLIALSQLQACKKQYGMDFEYPILANMYGPGDDFSDDKSHVVAALIKKFTSGIDKVDIWGDGRQSRDLLYVKDGASALFKFLTSSIGQPINIASGNGTTIRELVELLVELTDYKGEVTYNKQKPTGQLERCYSIRLAKMLLGWQPSASLRDGLKETIEWYNETLRRTQKRNS
jgi:GDP-L-fucose synthase